MTADLLELSDWLRRADCPHVAMESTGLYWKPVYNLLEGDFLEGDFEVLLVNAQHLKQGPGRKTDLRDAQWIAELLRRVAWPRPASRQLHPASAAACATRTDALPRHTRGGRRPHGAATATVQRLQKVLEEANVKLASVVRDVTGVSARALLEGLAAEHELDPGALAELARGRLRGKRVVSAPNSKPLLRACCRFITVS